MHGVRALGTPQEPCRCSEHTGCYQADRAVSYLQARHQRAALVRATNALRAGGRIAVQGGPQLHAPRVLPAIGAVCRGSLFWVGT